MMTRQERAKQFMPFDAMKGLQEALRIREERHTRVERRERSEDEFQIVASDLLRLERGDEIRLLYYRSFHEVEKTGILDKVDIIYRYIIFAGERIMFDDIYEIEKIN